MSTNHQVEPSLSVEEAAALARLAGITIADESLPLVAEMLAAVSTAADNLLVFPDSDVTGIMEAFDPAWPTSSRGGS